MFCYVFGYNHLREIDKKGFGFSRPAVFGGQPNTMLANRKESYKSLQLTFPFQPHTARFVVSRPQLARNGSNFDLFSFVGYFYYDGVKSQKRAFFELVIFVPSILYFRANKRTTTIFPHSKRKNREKKCRTQIEQSEHPANRINRIVKGIDDFVRLFAGF